MSLKYRLALIKTGFGVYAISFIAPNTFESVSPGGWYLFAVSLMAVFTSIEMAIPFVLLQVSNLGTISNLVRYFRGKQMNKALQIYASLSAFAWIPFFYFWNDARGAFGPSFFLWSTSITLLAILIPLEN